MFSACFIRGYSRYEFVTLLTPLRPINCRCAAEVKLEEGTKLRDFFTTRAPLMLPRVVVKVFMGSCPDSELSMRPAAVVTLPP